jgi:hypothetical protein
MKGEDPAYGPTVSTNSRNDHKGELVSFLVANQAPNTPLHPRIGRNVVLGVTFETIEERKRSICSPFGVSFCGELWFDVSHFRV